MRGYACNWCNEVVGPRPGGPNFVGFENAPIDWYTIQRRLRATSKNGEPPSTQWKELETLHFCSLKCATDFDHHNGANYLPMDET